MRIVLISDTHEHTMTAAELPAGDTIIHAGDFTVNGDLVEIETFNQWFSILPYRNKIVIAGNHELFFEDEPLRARALLDPSITYLEHEAITIDGVRFFGTPYQPYFCNWAFNVRESAQLAAMYSDIPTNTDVLITHCPPYRVLDGRWQGKALGSQELWDVYEQRLHSHLKLHVFGHIHHGYAQVQIMNTMFVNASICNDRGHKQNKPVIFDL